MALNDPNDLLFLSVPALFYLFLHRLYLIPTFAYLYQHRPHLNSAVRTMGLLRPTKRDVALAGIAVIFLTIIGLAIVYLFPHPIPRQAALPTSIGLMFVKGFIITLRGAGEEFLFRGFVQGIFAKRFSAYTAILAQALLSLLPATLLSFIEPSYWALLPPQFIVVLTLGFLRHHTKGIAAPLIVHVILNIFIMAAETTNMNL
ncbi:MAG: CPBP family intramembrane metalloprotease [Corynebacterium sp.]|nr:CPBP family intramembrane metalloprotease [Corynebacterium sp.]